MGETAIPAGLGARFLGALAEHDYDTLGSCFAADGELRGIVPAGLREADGRRAISERFRLWTENYEVVESDESVFSDTLKLRWVVKGIDEDIGLNVFEQTAYAEIEDGEIARMRLSCSGHRPV